jgi:hypothetical protein
MVLPRRHRRVFNLQNEQTSQAGDGPTTAARVGAIKAQIKYGKRNVIEFEKHLLIRSYSSMMRSPLI